MVLNENIYMLVFQRVVITFHRGIVIWAASTAHALLNGYITTKIIEFFRCELTSLVAMKNQALAWEVPLDGYFQGFYGKTCCDLAAV